MYTLLIVEDETLIRKGLMQYFDWNALGFHTIYEAENGSEGVEIARKERPDLVITDIRMPLMDGLDMIGALRQDLPDTLFVIWTGYNEFAYAQKAIRLGNVFAYLLKPLQYEESMRTIHDCIQHLERLRESQQKASMLQLNQQHGLRLQRSQLVKQMIEDEMISPALEKDLWSSLSNLNSANCLFQPFVLSYVPQPDALLESRSWWRLHAEPILTKALTMYLKLPNIHPVLFTYLHQSKLYAFTILEIETAAFLTPKLTTQQYQEITDLLYQESSSHHVHLYMAAGVATPQLNDLPSLLKQTDRALFQRFSSTAHQTFYESLHSGSESAWNPVHPLLEQDKMKLLSHLEQGDGLQIQQLMNRLSVDYQSKIQHFTLEQWLSLLQEMIAVAIRFAGKHGIQLEEVYPEKLITLRFVDDFDSVSTLLDWLATWMIQLQEDARISSVKPTDITLFEQIETYILQHMDQEITLQMVADRFFYNPSYLSRLFKTKLDKNYMTFVTEIRMNYAKRCLLESNDAMTDICQKCGYTSYKHFVKTFRKFTNMTPTDYRKQMGMMD
ncbi:two-component system response regulator YesN [Paenibacillus shirakamiensis]|uniref:Two-component system response regulator YesN n=1 Tax=Paenibacillus shirakamiensis TaxID=1265935 RepID=A0ABS4JKJ7_9BACL|nr:helix-turn-helix domain-containing protein [Paenibacillus shirakamiensis]MBP2002228.1 two-component system response regulator YesN [Paenibacillus shirakamiensis]